MRPVRQSHFTMQIYGQRGERLYLDEAERQRFLAVVNQQTPELQTFGLVLFYTGCRLSEALALTTDSLRLTEGVICFRTLKRRGLFMREVPVPTWLIRQLLESAPAGRLWAMHRATA